MSNGPPQSVTHPHRPHHPNPRRPPPGCLPLLAMPTISDVERKARKSHRCANGCSPDCSRIIKPGETYRRLYGMAERGDKPYAIAECLACWKLHERVAQ